jgi:tRNA-dihydrouridine synthase
MIGRALLGAPWKISDKVLPEEHKKIIEFHLAEMEALRGEDSILDMRKHILFYCANIPCGKELKKQISACSSFAEARRLLL